MTARAAEPSARTDDDPGPGPGCECSNAVIDDCVDVTGGSMEWRCLEARRQAQAVFTVPSRVLLRRLALRPELFDALTLAEMLGVLAPRTGEVLRSPSLRRPRLQSMLRVYRVLTVTTSAHGEPRWAQPAVRRLREDILNALPQRWD